MWVARRVPDGYIGGHANQARYLVITPVVPDGYIGGHANQVRYLVTTPVVPDGYIGGHANQARIRGRGSRCQPGARRHHCPR